MTPEQLAWIAIISSVVIPLLALVVGVLINRKSTDAGIINNLTQSLATLSDEVQGLRDTIASMVEGEYLIETRLVVGKSPSIKSVSVKNETKYQIRGGERRVSNEIQ